MTTTRNNGITIFYADTGVINGGDTTAGSGWYVCVTRVCTDGTPNIVSDAIGPFDSPTEAFSEGQMLLADMVQNDGPFVPNNGNPYLFG